MNIAHHAYYNSTRSHINQNCASPNQMAPRMNNVFSSKMTHAHTTLLSVSPRSYIPRSAATLVLNLIPIIKIFYHVVIIASGQKYKPSPSVGRPFTRWNAILSLPPRHLAPPTVSNTRLKPGNNVMLKHNRNCT